MRKEFIIFRYFILIKNRIKDIKEDDKSLYLKLEKIFHEKIFLKKYKKSSNLSSINQIRKDYFRITFCLDLMCDKNINGYKFVCVLVEFLAFKSLNLNKKCWVIDIVHQLSLKNPLKTGFSIRKILLQYVSGVIGL